MLEKWERNRWKRGILGYENGISGECKAGEQKKADEMKECLEDFASAQEKRAYIQGYVDCVQALYHMGLLKENEGLKWAEKVDQK